MGRRKEPRIRMVLPTKLWTDAEGPFPLGQSCVTQNITRHGVCVEGVPNLKVGQTITLAYHQKKSRFRVAWVGAAGSPQAKLAGLENLEPERLIFGVGFPGESADDYQVPEPRPSVAPEVVVPPAWDGKERRASARYDCAGEAELREDGGQAVTLGKLADISQGGCYVEMMTPFPAGTRLQMTLTVADVKIRLNGIVRVAHREGMGVQFTESAPEERARLAQLIHWLAHGSVGSPAAAPPAVPASVSADRAATTIHDVDPRAVLNSLVKWFSSRNTLSREEFLTVLTQSRAGKRESSDTPKR